VITDRDSVRLDGREVQVDVIEFERAVHEGRLEDAVCLHRGEFLPEDVYGQWAIAPRERWRASALAALRALAARHADAESDADAVIVTLQQLLALDRFDLDAHHRLVTALHRGGRMGEARRAHERYAHHAAELGLEARTIAAIIGTVERT
jgi:DNA-binding SARP family transcriptional activator